ncbi:MAG: DNA mismatch repair protein MutT [Chitinophagales bacterium]|nr:MAG: DNA mismatch repair protein MutT [Chitinophagales bacterium]
MNNPELKEEQNPWTTLSEKIVYDNPWMQVREYRVINPAGKASLYGIVSAKHLAIGIIPLDAQNNTWLVGQYRYPLKAYSWEIVEGGGKPDIDPVESARRELKEETGLEARHYTKIMEMHTSNCISDEKAIIYVARGISEGIASPDEDEKLKVVKLPFDEVFKMVMEGRITDSLSVAGILKTHLLLQTGTV